MLEYKFDTQLLIEGKNLNEDEINDYITEHFQGDCLLAVGDDELKFIFIPMNHGLFYNMLQHLEKSMILLLKIWKDRHKD